MKIELDITGMANALKISEEQVLQELWLNRPDHNNIDYCVDGALDEQDLSTRRGWFLRVASHFVRRIE